MKLPSARAPTRRYETQPLNLRSRSIFRIVDRVIVLQSIVLSPRLAFCSSQLQHTQKPFYPDTIPGISPSCACVLSRLPEPALA
jgi:hypothetical protein